MTLFTKLRRLPVFGPLLKIANAYAFQGDYRAANEFAGIRCWVRAIGPELFFATALSAATMWQFLYKCWTAQTILPCVDEFYCKPGALIVAFVPSTLGFGIGVYALIFSLSVHLLQDLKDTVKKQRDSGKREDGSELMLNSDMAFPLVILTFCLFLGIFQQIAPSSISLVALTWIILWYSLISILDLISVIFGMADNSILDKLK